LKLKPSPAVRKRLRWTVAIAAVVVLVLPLLMSSYVRTNGASFIVEAEAAESFAADCVLVLGAGLRPDGSPSLMLRDRLDRAVELYNAGAAPKLLLSGDNGTVSYNEVAAMKKYVLGAGIPAKDVFLDYAGFSTYESMVRARSVFMARRVIVVTQRYHLYRALYDADRQGLTAVGVAARDIAYRGQKKRDLREIPARSQDFLKVLLKWPPKYLGNEIPVTGDGRVTH
jgi:vancomycin permeability regulator SanA